MKPHELNAFDRRKNLIWIDIDRLEGDLGDGEDQCDAHAIFPTTDEN